MVDEFGVDGIRKGLGCDHISNAAIYFTAGESGPEFYRWRCGQLSDGSQTDLNILSVLKAARLPRRPQLRRPDSH
jgi:hypothetical protein